MSHAVTITPDPDPTCAGCGLSLDLAEPHISLVRQHEVEHGSNVTVLAAWVLEHRHEGCEVPR